MGPAKLQNSDKISLAFKRILPVNLHPFATAVRLSAPHPICLRIAHPGSVSARHLFFCLPPCRRSPAAADRSPRRHPLSSGPSAPHRPELPPHPPPTRN